MTKLQKQEHPVLRASKRDTSRSFFLPALLCLVLAVAGLSCWQQWSLMLHSDPEKTVVSIHIERPSDAVAESQTASTTTTSTADRYVEWKAPPPTTSVASTRRTVAAWLGHTFVVRDGPYCRDDDCRLSFPGALQDSPLQWLGTRKGQKPGPNQDRSLLVASSSSSSNDKFFLASLLDGHGSCGHDVADQGLLSLPLKLLVQQDSVISSSKTPEQYLHDAFMAADQDVLHIGPCGTTAVLAMQWQNQLILASVGDSTALLVKASSSSPDNGTTTILAQAVHHKPASEKARIEAAGGRVWVPPPFIVPAASSRVFYQTGNMETGLAMSRSLGDPDGKRPGYLTAEPSVITVENLREQVRQADDDEFLFVVVASDGVMDMIPTDDAIHALEKALRQRDAENLSAVCRQLMDRASENWHRQMQGTYRDDMTLVVARLNL